MITEDMYKGYLNSKGRNLSETRRHHSAMIVNDRFTEDPNYKRVYLLDSVEGWIWTDVKYSQHSRQSIAKDDVDYYIQFRPNEHHTVGTYVFIPDDTDPEIGFSEETPINPFNDKNFEHIFDKGKLWMIVDRNNSSQFVRYMALQCNWLFKWIVNYKGERRIMSCYGITRTQSSYTSGQWVADRSVELDNVTALFLPDTNYIFGEDRDLYGLDDTRYFDYDLRLMLSTNTIHPKCYRVTKITELAPKGVLKCTVKQDEYDAKKDNVNLMICNYYDEDGDITIDENIPIDPDHSKTSIISFAKNTEDGIVEDPEGTNELVIGSTSYFIATFSDDSPTEIQWRIDYVDVTEDDLTLSNERKEYYCGLLKITHLAETCNDENKLIHSISVRPNKVKSLVNKKFKLNVENYDGEYKSSILLEVAK